MVDFTKLIDPKNPICPLCKEEMNLFGRKAWCYNFSCDVLWRYLDNRGIDSH